MLFLLVIIMDYFDLHCDTAYECYKRKQDIYNGLGCVDISVEPHFVRSEVSNELIDLSKKYTIYGLCDDSFIVCSEKTIEFYGEIYKLSHGNIERL